MIGRSRKASTQLMIRDQKDVTRTIIKVALFSLVASWLITGVVMMFVGGLTTSTIVVAAVASTKLMAEGQLVGIKASIGVVSNQGQNDNADLLLRQADQALYRAKELGGDRVELAA